MKKEIVGQKFNTKNGSWIKVMAFADNYYMVRRKGFMPFVLDEKAFVKLINDECVVVYPTAHH